MYDQDRSRTQELLRQQTALARFGEFALKSDDLDEILREACGLVGQALGTDLAKVMECCEGGNELLVRAGVGWKPGIVGHVVVRTGQFSSAGHALRTCEPVITPDVEQEDRFEIPGFLKDHGVQAMVNVIVLGADGKPPYGVLEVDSRTPRQFTEDDASFLRTYANLLASAVERLRAGAALRARAKEKERLLQELQHRIKNNLQVITSLVRIQASRARHPEAERELTAIGHRVETLRLVHDKLYAAGGAERLDLGTYLSELMASLLQFHGEGARNVRLASEVGSLLVSPELAVPIGIIVTEFITNSLKYAFPDGRGLIGVRLEATPGTARLILWDDGKGLPEARPSGTGMQLIAGFARQIGAEAEWESDKWESDSGAKLSLTLPVGAGRGGQADRVPQVHRPGTPA